jgi:hypothetical protein
VHLGHMPWALTKRREIINKLTNINKDRLKDKVNNFVKENRMNLLNKDPTEAYQKQIHQDTKLKLLKMKIIVCYS